MTHLTGSYWKPLAVNVLHGGMKFYRGSAADARVYVEQDRSRVDDYYLTEGSSIATRYIASPLTGVRQSGSLTGESYEIWVSGFDAETGAAKGRLRSDPKALRFVEVVVNGPKTWSLAAALHPEIADALDAAQTRAAEQIIGWVAEHATTRVGPKGRQVQVPVTEIEAVVVRHYTSRAGDPHRHLHVQINARVLAEGTWRGLHSVGMRDSLNAINGIGHAAVVTDPEFRAALVAHGFTLDPATGELAELAPFVGRFSARTAQIGRNLDRYEAKWRAANLGVEPGPGLHRAWDRRAWAETRPDKIVPKDGAALAERWNEELHALGYRDPDQVGLPIVVGGPQAGALERERAVDVVLSRLGARRSAWNAADIRGEVEQWIASTGLVAVAAVRIDLAEDLTARALGACGPLLQRYDVPEHIRALTSPEVLAVEADIVTRLIHRAEQPVRLAAPDDAETGTLDVAQRAAVAALGGNAALLVVEGAAGAGMTTTLSATTLLLTQRGRRMLVVTPTLKAAEVAGREIGAVAFSAAWLAHQYGWRWDDNGRWTRESSTPAPAAVLRSDDLLLIDEAGMLDQDTARALLTIADETRARVAFLGDRHQLPAVGRGGMLDLAARWARPEAVLSLDMVHRFTDPEYAAISLAMRTGTSLSAAIRTSGERVGEPERLVVSRRNETFTNRSAGDEPSGERIGEVFNALLNRDQIRIYPSEAERTQALADLAAASILAGQSGVLVMADTREDVAALNGAVRDRLVAAGYVDDRRAIVTAAGERLGVGDRVATRRNDRELAVANRDTWTIAAIDPAGTVTVQGDGHTGSRSLPSAYVRNQVELAYATTVYGAQGETTHIGHFVLGEHTTGAAAYVGMTRGREDNVAHLVAENLDDARNLWNDTFGRDRADLGPAHAAQRAAEDVERYAPHRPLNAALTDLRAAWTDERDLKGAIGRTERRRDLMACYGEPVATRVTEINAEIDELRDLLATASSKVRTLLHEPAIRSLPSGRIEQEHADWLQQRQQAQQAARARWEAFNTPRPSGGQRDPGYVRTPDRGRGIGR
ncbi:MobF family relaxase [soil metagenome]